MSYPVFQVPAGDVLPIFFDTFAGATGASITMTGLAVTDIEVYKDGGATQRASDAGFALLDTDGIDFDGITGIHGFSIDTGDNTDAGFYTVGAWFTVVVSAVTVDTQAVSFIAAMFRIMAAEGVAGVPDVNVTHLADTAQSPGDIFGEASDALPSLPTLASYLDTEIAAIKAKTDNLPTDPADQSLIIAATDAIFNRIGAPAGASVSADVAAIQADTNDLQTRVPAALVGGRIDASVGAMENNVMTAAAAAADLTTELQSGLATAANLATVAGYLDTEIASILATTTKLDSMLENSSDGWIYTVAALQQAPAGGSGLDAAGVRAAIGLASANLDAQLDALPTAAENATAVMGSTVEGTFDLTESARLWNAALAGKASGLATATATFRDLADGKDRIVATVDADGNRTAVTRDVT